MSCEESALATATSKMTAFKTMVHEYFKGLYFKVINSQIGHHKMLIRYYVCKSFHYEILTFFTMGKIDRFFFEFLDEMCLLS